MKYLVEKEVLDKVFNYILSRPFSEVHELVPEFKAATQLLKAPEPTPEAPASNEQAQG